MYKFMVKRNTLPRAPALLTPGNFYLDSLTQ